MLLAVRRALALLAVVVATGIGATVALTAFHQTRALSVGEIRMSVWPGHRGALDVYVPLVDWGVRFDAIRAPLRLQVDLQTVDRAVVTRIAEGGSLDIEAVRSEARDALAAYLRLLIGLTLAAGAALGLLTALAVRSRSGPRLRWTAGVAVLTAAAIAVALVVLIPPRGEISDPQYYAHGPDIPRALSAIEAVQRSPGALDQELDAQLLGLARLVVAPGERTSLAGAPSVTIASDLHNNVLAIPVLGNVAGGGPILFAGDLTDRGSPVETRLVRRVAQLGRPFVFVTGNHDSDFLSRQLARVGAIVLTQDGRLEADGSLGPVVARVAGLRVAGYSDPYERREGEDFADRYDNAPTPAMQDAFLAWLRPLIGKVDVVMVHEPALIATALAVLRDRPPSAPIVFAVGHTHRADLQTQPGVTVVNGGSVGAGGTGNLTERTEIGVARLTFTRSPAFQPLAADLVSVDPGTGSSTARRVRLSGAP